VWVEAQPKHAIANCSQTVSPMLHLTKESIPPIADLRWFLFTKLDTNYYSTGFDTVTAVKVLINE